jgi:hypothetical protein
MSKIRQEWTPSLGRPNASLYLHKFKFKSILSVIYLLFTLHIFTYTYVNIKFGVWCSFIWVRRHRIRNTLCRRT